jgi:uncharacterized DUF497 family protein
VLGLLDARVFAAIVTHRNETIRIISARPASRKERALYHDATNTDT